MSAGRGLYVNDRLVWSLLVFIPTGPSSGQRLAGTSSSLAKVRHANAHVICSLGKHGLIAHASRRKLFNFCIVDPWRWPRLCCMKLHQWFRKPSTSVRETGECAVASSRFVAYTCALSTTQRGS
ncbi:hypothetical protein A0H81_12021 [Grifola frondosa]|uniref:Uncharacterized protein n=1 Tax=Grifola frondosa TaxID=5627 RepID=A0A1C7LT45_GRIFR|nr:hypothetical protein A0H81_12021 [Grifola frondosa]